MKLIRRSFENKVCHMDHSLSMKFDLSSSVLLNLLLYSTVNESNNHNAFALLSQSEYEKSRAVLCTSRKTRITSKYNFKS